MNLEGNNIGDMYGSKLLESFKSMKKLKILILNKNDLGTKCSCKFQELFVEIPLEHLELH